MIGNLLLLLLQIKHPQLKNEKTHIHSNEIL